MCFFNSYGGGRTHIYARPLTRLSSPELFWKIASLSLFNFSISQMFSHSIKKFLSQNKQITASKMTPKMMSVIILLVLLLPIGCECESNPIGNVNLQRSYMYVKFKETLEESMENIITIKIFLIKEFCKTSRRHLVTHLI